MVRQGVYFETEQSRSLSSSTVISRTQSSTAHLPPPLYSLVAEIQILGVRVVVDEKAALDGIQVHLERGTAPCQLLLGLTAYWRPGQALQGLMGLHVVSMDCWLETWFQPTKAAHSNSLMIISNKQNLRPLVPRLRNCCLITNLRLVTSLVSLSSPKVGHDNTTYPA